MQAKQRILELVEPLFGDDIELYDEYWGGPISFNINERLVNVMLDNFSPERIDDDDWYFISNVYWGQGYHSTLYINLDGEYNIIHV